MADGRLKLLQKPMLPDLRAVQDMGLKMKAAHLHLNEWKNNYMKTVKQPSDQVIFMANNILRKLEKEFEYFPEGRRFQLSRIQKERKRV